MKSHEKKMDEQKLEEKDRKKLRLKEIIPLDEYLKINTLPFKMSRPMMVEAAFWGQHESSYKSAEKVLRKIYPVEITDSLIREVTDEEGWKVYCKDCDEAQDVDKNMKKIPVNADKSGVLYGFADGAAINTRHKNADGSTWRENKLGEFYSSDHMRKRKDKKTYDVQKKEYTDYLGDVEHFKKQFFDCAVRNGYGHYKTTVIISDGAKWIKNMCDELFPDAVQILDLYHVEENIYSFGKQLYKEDSSKYTPWAEEIIALVKASKTDEALEKLKPYEHKKFAVDVVNPYTYILHNKERMDYAGYEKKGWCVGSGAIESGNKTVLQRRCKGTGMRWNTLTAQAVLSLRAKDESGLWETGVVPFLLNT
jgi:hypothetical protein